MSVIVGVAKAVSVKVLTGTRPTTRIFPKTKWILVVAFALLALVACAALIPVSQAPNAEHSSVVSKDYQSGVPLSEPGAPQTNEKAALEAYGKLPLSSIPNEGQTDKAVRYYAQGAGYGFFFTKEGTTLSFAGVTEGRSASELPANCG
jgi:hypothetical protein